MLVKLLSDLHLHGNYPFTYVDNGERVCVLAGDVSEGMNGVFWAEDSIPDHIQVLYVPGNHEYYGQDYSELNSRFMEFNKRLTHVKILLNDSMLISNVEFVGSTLWTDFCLYGDQNLHALTWKHGLNDARYISNKGRLISSQDFIKWNKQALRYINSMAHQTRSIDTVRVLITHYCPELSVAPKYRGDMLTPGFATKIPNHIHSAFDFHFHGHTHDSMNYENALGVKVRCNPRGYSFEGGDFNKELVLDL